MMKHFRKIIGTLFGFQHEIDDLRSRVSELSWDSVFGMWTRTAFLQFCRVMPRTERTIVFIDLDRIHSLNRRHGYTEVDRMVRDAFSIPLRQSDIVARWYSGDEIVILFDNDQASACMKIQELERSAARQGLSFTHEMGVWDVGSRDIIDVVNGLSARNKRKQECRGAECETRL